MSLLEIKDLGFKYDGASEPALRGVSLTVSPGEVILLCGPTGSGKTTFLRSLLKNEDLRAERVGTVEFFGSRIGYVGQSSGVFATDRVRYELAFAAENTNFPPNVTRRRVAEIASALGLGAFYDRRVSSLSGGERRLVSLGAAMAASPELLLLDEPTASLDPVTAARFYDTLLRLARENGTALIISEHKTELLCDRADRMAVLKRGELVALDKPERLARLLDDGEIRGFLPVSARALAPFPSETALPLTVSKGRELLAEQLGARRPRIVGAERKFGEMALELKNIDFSYGKAERPILGELSLTLGAGEALCLLGANGSGKSTLLSVAAGFLRASSGKVKIFGKRIEEYRGNSLYDGTLAYLPQDISSVFVNETVKEEIGGAEPPFDISGIRDRDPRELSGGEARLAALAVALAKKPRILLLDEPLRGLDPRSKEMIAGVLRELRDRGTAILAVTHDPDTAPLFADRCALLFGGEICAEGETRKFLSEGEFFTTAAKKLAKGFIDGAVTEGDIREALRGK